MIVIFHDQRQWIDRAVRSVLQQSGPTIELILVDDGSTDGSMDVALSAAGGHPRTTAVRRERAHSCAAARNAGITAATGEFISFLDGDDEYVENGLAPMLAHLVEHPGCDLVIGERVLAVEPGATVPTMLGSQTTGSRAPHYMTMMMPRRTLDALGGFDCAFDTGGEDVEFVLRTRRIGLQIDVVGHLVLRYRIHGTNMIYGTSRLRGERLRIVQQLHASQVDELRIDPITGRRDVSSRRHGSLSSSSDRARDDA